jgi:hypothetical protein
MQRAYGLSLSGVVDAIRQNAVASGRHVDAAGSLLHRVPLERGTYETQATVIDVSDSLPPAANPVVSPDAQPWGRDHGSATLLESGSAVEPAEGLEPAQHLLVHPKESNNKHQQQHVSENNPAVLQQHASMPAVLPPAVLPPAVPKCVLPPAVLPPAVVPRIVMPPTQQLQHHHQPTQQPVQQHDADAPHPTQQHDAPQPTQEPAHDHGHAHAPLDGAQPMSTTTSATDVQSQALLDEARAPATAAPVAGVLLHVLAHVARKQPRDTDQLTTHPYFCMPPTQVFMHTCMYACMCHVWSACSYCLSMLFDVPCACNVAFMHAMLNTNSRSFTVHIIHWRSLNIHGTFTVHGNSRAFTGNSRVIHGSLKFTSVHGKFTAQCH